MADTMNQMNDDALVRCENVSKKFCRGLKRSLWYGVQDICEEINPLRKNDTPPGKGNIPQLRKDEFWAVNDISFELKRGECLGLIGHNGAGKSTLLKMLNGLIKPDHGKITMKGRIGALIELNAGFNPILTGRENIYIYGTILGFTKKEIDQKYDDIVEFAEMAEFMEMPFRSYSSGMKVRLGFAVAAQMEPDVLIIDEVLAVGDAAFSIKCLNLISELLKACAIIFVSHAMPQVGKICNSAILMKNGAALSKSNNVPTVINKYFSKIALEKGISFGSGQAEIESFHFITDNNLNTKENISTAKSNLTFIVNLNVSKAIKNYYISIIFINLEFRGIAVASSTEKKLIFSNKQKNNNEVKITIPNYFAPGKYSANFEVFEAIGDKLENTGALLLSARNIIEFISTGSNQMTFCPVQLPSEWETSN